MKKAILFAAVFLVGITAQTFAQRNQQQITIPGKAYRYHNSQYINFVEDGVLYFVSSDGSFDFQFVQRVTPRKKGRRNYHNFYNGRGRSNAIKYDRFGNIRRIGKTNITYKRNGKVKTIGIVPLYYERGRLIQAGNMQITYNRFGNIRDTYGFVNRDNKNSWHDDWYVNNEYDCNLEVDRYDYERKRKRKTR
jgi:hypothetical protein